jgi:hypothetical protein
VVCGAEDDGVGGCDVGGVGEDCGDGEVEERVG